MASVGVCTPPKRQGSRRLLAREDDSGERDYAAYLEALCRQYEDWHLGLNDRDLVQRPEPQPVDPAAPAEVLQHLPGDHRALPARIGSGVERVIIATDPGREGSMIAWEVLEHLGWRGRVGRSTRPRQPRCSSTSQAIIEPSRPGSVAMITRSTPGRDLDPPRLRAAGA
jgi:hypothetical protein